MVDLELYRIFKTVADEENLTRASEKLNISQPAVTKHIHNLENELKVKLFTRTRYGMILTEDGKKIYSQIKDPISVLVNVENSIKQDTSLNLGIHTNFPQKLYSIIIDKLKQKDTNLDISIEKTYTENMFQLLEKQEIDAYLSKKQPENVHDNSIKFVPLGYFHDDFFVNKGSKYLKKNIFNEKEHITIYTLRTVSSTSKRLEKIVAEKKLKNIEIKNATFSTIFEKMQTEDIIAYITEEYITDDLDKGNIKRLSTSIKPFEVEYGAYYNTNNKLKNIKKLFENIK
ncbi:MAG: LysR family transcriptional regulator [Clostridia bacterium]|nr:LysR family transcriptional regulator [Clostridia bacterium]